MIVSGCIDEADFKRGFSVGADESLSISFAVPELLAKCDLHLARYAERRETAASAPAAGTQPTWKRSRATSRASVFPCRSEMMAVRG